MSAVRGYGFGHAEPRHEVKKRTYRPCVECGQRTWSPRGLCSTCSGRAAYHRKVIMYGCTGTKEKKQRAREIYRLLKDTDMPQIKIAEQHGVTDKLVTGIRNGRIWTDITGGYVTRPYERGTPREQRRKFTNDLAREIYHQLRDTNARQKAIATSFGVSPTYVNKIRLGKTHTAITGGYVLRPAERGNS